MILKTEKETLRFGEEVGKCLPNHFILYLHGDLGAGKTTLTRGILRGMGYHGRVKSPTFTVVEPYEMNHRMIYHFDLYRLSDPEELEYIGARDYFESSICIVEWPSNGMTFLPEPDLDCYLSIKNSSREIELTARTEKGLALKEKIGFKNILES